MKPYYILKVDGLAVNVVVNMTTGIAKVWLAETAFQAPTFDTAERAQFYADNYVPELKATPCAC